MKRKKKSKINPNYIHHNKSSVSLPNDTYVTVPTETWFDIKESGVISQGSFDKEIKYETLTETKYRSDKIRLYPSVKQRKILDSWFKGFRIIYNYALKEIKKTYLEKKYKPYFKKIRMSLYDKKYSIQKHHNGIKIHILDRAIKLACSNYKSAITNFRNKNIPKFRIRYWKINQTKKILKVEKNDMKTINFLYSINAYLDGKKYDIKNNVEAECIFTYDTTTDEYYLYAPSKLKKIDDDQINDTISLDPGLRTFLTGVSNTKGVQICNNLMPKLEYYLNKIYKTKNPKSHKRCYRKITNYVDELHWKSINYLVKNYKNILIGNMSSKSTNRNSTSKLSPTVKKMLQYSSIFKFRQRLKFKCFQYNRNYIEVNESYTSKTCSMCGVIKENLGSNKTFECKSCKTVMDRDINGSRNIYYKGCI